MAITTTCSGCGKTLAVADEYAGRQARCPQCGQIYTVPMSTSPVSPSPMSPTPLSTPTSPQAPATLSPIASGGPLNLDNPLGSPTAADSAIQYWMKAADGKEYGPVDSTSLARWFSEGRVGTGYQIRAGENGVWQPAATFQAAANPAASTNPFASYAPGPGVGQVRQYAKPDQSGIVLAMGILSWIVCPICGIVAWVMGGQALKDMQSGAADPTNRGLVQVGYYLGMVHVIVTVCCCGAYVVFIAIAAATGGFN